jgi:hypothetical protein
LDGYRLSASGEAEIGDKIIAVSAVPWLNFTNAKALCALNFDIAIDANVIIPHLNKVNKE